MMLRLPDRTIDKRQLAKELAALNLPGYTGIYRGNRDIGANGRVVLENGVPKRVPPYILVKSGALSGPQITAVTTAVLNHVPSLDPQRGEKQRQFVRESAGRIVPLVPDWDTVATIKAAAGLWSAVSANASPAQVTAMNIYFYARDTALTKLAALSTVAAIAAVDPTIADPFGDGTPWPS